MRNLNFFRESVIASFWPVSFVILVVWAFRVDNAVLGLFLMLGAFLLQTMVTSDSFNRRGDSLFRWNRFREFSEYRLPYLGQNGIIVMIANVVFNLLKVATIVCTAIFIQLKFSTRFLATEVFLIGGFFVVEAMMTMSKKRLYNYKMFRAYLGLLLFISLVFMVLISFGSQLIWVPFFLVILFLAQKAFRELTEMTGLKWPWNKIILSMLLITAAVSTIYQFSSSISEALVNSFLWLNKFIVSQTAEILALGFIILCSIAILFFVARKANASSKAKRQKREAKEAIEKRTKERAEKEKRILARLDELLNHGHSENRFTLDDLLFIINNKSYLGVKPIYRKSLDWRLTKTGLTLLLQVCHEKQQVVFDSSSAEILKLYNEAYVRNYDDQLLRGLGDRIYNLNNYLCSSVKDYKGVKELSGIMYRELHNIPNKYINIRANVLPKEND